MAIITLFLEQQSAVLFLLIVLHPDNPSVMALYFPDLTTYSSPADVPESGNVHLVCRFTSRPVFLHSHSYIQIYLAL